MPNFQYLSAWSIILTNSNADQIYYSAPPYTQFDPIDSHPPNLGASQLPGSIFRLFSSSKFFIAAAYPEAFIYSLDSGSNWEYTGLPNMYPLLIFDDTLIVSRTLVEPRVIINSNYNLTQIDTLGSLAFQPYGATFLGSDLAFIIGEDGNMIKNTHVTATSIKESQGLKKKLRLYPNPAQGRIIVETERGMEIQQMGLYDLKGALIKSFGAHQRELNVQHIAHGQYVLRILTGDGVITENVQVGHSAP